MGSFRKFLEISVNMDMDAPSGFKSPRSPMAKVHAEDDPSHGVIPFTVKQSMLGPARELVEMGSRLGKHARAASVFQRILQQSEEISDGGPLLVYISNMEADDLERMGKEFVEDSRKVLSSNMDSRNMKDEAMKWMAFGNNVLAAVGNGMIAATSRTK